eukprot:SAG11_NODE_3933_length_2143_cov_2.172211_1_plen_82_part_00
MDRTPPPPPPPSASLGAVDKACALSQLEEYFTPLPPARRERPRFAQALLHLQWLMPPASPHADAAIIAACCERLGLLFLNG